MKKHYSYVALLSYDSDGICIEFPDLPGCYSCADVNDTDMALRNAREALGLHIWGMEQDNETLPVPTPITDISLEANQVPALIEVFMPPFREHINNRPEKKALSLPTGLSANCSKLFYPAIFHVADEGGFWITFPDLPECMTQGDDMQEAYEMAVDALGLALTSREQEKQEIPTASELSQITLNENEYCVVIEFDMLAYKKRTNSKAVKKTLSIPEWLNEEAVALGLNFSQVLQEALVQKINAKS